MLTINISELLLTVLSFFVLMFLLNRLLFKPVIRFREQRQSRMDESFERERLAKEQQAKLEEELRQQRGASLKEAEKIAAQTGGQVEENSLQAVKQVERQTQEALEQAANEAERLKQAGQTELEEQKHRLAALLADRLCR